MSTATEFPEIHWDRLRTEMEQNGPDAAIAFIESLDDPDRLKLYSFAQGAFANRDWNGKNLNAIIVVANAGINHALKLAGVTEDADKARSFTDLANMNSYNLSATLAECWPGDDMPRTREHFEEGLRAAENCIRWREELNKPPGRRAIAFWAQGMHALSLHNLDTALAGFQQSFEYGKAGAIEANKSPEISVNGDFHPILAAGYLGIAQHASGKTEGAELYQQACSAFEAQAATSEEKETREDAEFGLAQLRKVAAKYGPA